MGSTGWKVAQMLREVHNAVERLRRQRRCKRVGASEKLSVEWFLASELLC
jgi:hypothetical protein